MWILGIQISRILCSLPRYIWRISRPGCSKVARPHTGPFRCQTRATSRHCRRCSRRAAWAPWCRRPWSWHSFSATFWPGRTGSPRQSRCPWCWWGSCHRSQGASCAACPATKQSTGRARSESATYNGVTSCIGSPPVTSGQVLEASLCDVLAKDLCYLFLILGLLQGVGQSSDPSEISGGSEVLKENCALVGVAESEGWVRRRQTQLIAYSLARHLSPDFSPGQNLAEQVAASRPEMSSRLLMVESWNIK